MPKYREADPDITYQPLTVFVPDGGNRDETRVLLLGTAQEFGLPARDIQSDRSKGGFWITEALADIVYDDVEETVSGNDPDPQTPDKAPAETGKTVTKKGQTK